jgi:DNA-binding response OmpR family regulator
MGTKNRKLRLDEILVREGLISEEQIKDALMRQKAHGGKFGSQLLYHRHIDEAGLVKALAMQFNCEGVVLSELQIPQPVLQCLPKKVAVARKVVPFDYDPENNILKVACEDPNDQSLFNELNFVARGKEVKLYVAAEIALNTAIARYYLGRDVSLDDSLLLEIPDEATETVRKTSSAVEEAPPEIKDFQNTVLLVTDEQFSGPLLQSILERDNYRVMITDSADDAIDLIGDSRFDSVFIKDSVPGDYIDLIDRLRKISPKTTVRYYDSAASLVLNKDAAAAEGDLLVKGFDLLTSLLSSKYQLVTNHSGVVGHYVDKLCHRIGLPQRDRLAITSAAYLHDLAKFYYSSENTQDPRTTIKLSAKLLESLNFSPVVIGILQSMYIDLGGKYTKRLPIEAFGGNILTIVDLFCENIPLDSRLSLDKFDAIKKKLRDLTGKLFLGEVVETFIVLVQEEILQSQTAETNGQVMIYTAESDLLSVVEMRARQERFRTVTERTLESFVDLYHRSQPDMVVLLFPGRSVDVADRVDELAAKGIDFKKTATFLLADGPAATDLTKLLEKGIEDILALEGNLDLLMAKMHKVQERIQQERLGSDTGKLTTGSHGRLADMNVIDLLQALGPSRKLVRITIIPTGDAIEKLVMYLDHGRITFAQYKEKIGAEAVYEGIGWTDGVWTVEPISTKELPPPNNDLSNESILMEGCRLLDERVKAGQLL